MKFLLLLAVWSLGAAPVRLKIVSAGAEAVPYIKTGGLADVLSALHRGYAQAGHQSTLFLPRYPQLRAELAPTGVKVEVPVAGRVEVAELFKDVRNPGVYFLDNPAMYSDKGPYSPKGSYDDTDERFIFFSRGVVEAVKKLGLSPDVFHAHDWHAALIPAMVERDPQLKKAAAVTTIHNIAYQGVFEPATLEKAGLDPNDFHWQRFEYHGKFSMLKAGLVTSDGITTVSPTYMQQITGSPEFGMGLEGLLQHRSDSLRGILNAVEDDPRADRLLAQNYDVETAAVGKAVNKGALQNAAGLERRADAPVFIMASRLVHQKGVDLVLEAAELITRLGGQLLIVGSGDARYEQRLAELQREHPGKIFHHPFSETFVRLAYAGADFILMPSRFEPCGLSQMIAQLYGTLPIATRTGGLADTIKDVHENPGDGDGFFLRDFSIEAMKDAVAHAVAFYHAPGQLDAARRVAMTRDRAWDARVREYLEFFRALWERKNGSE